MAEAVPAEKKDFSQTIDTPEQAIDELLVMVTTVFIFMMQLGFALVETGSVRAKNSKNILIKNLFDVAAGALAFWLVGFGLAYVHPDKKGFAGNDSNMFAASGFNTSEKNMYLIWIYQFSHAATGSTIVSGSLAERTKLPAYMIFSCLMTGFIYPVVAGWCSDGGWLGDANEGGKGFHDFAGCGWVHMVGGVAGLCGAVIIGPRHMKEKDPSKRRDVRQTQEYIELSEAQVAKEEFQHWVLEMAEDDSFEANSFPF